MPSSWAVNIEMREYRRRKERPAIPEKHRSKDI
jgi:hypothetical protein